MADWLPLYRSWAEEWQRNWAEVLSASSAAAASLGMPQPGTLPGDPFVMMVAAARSWLVGKKRTFRLAGHELTLLLTDISVDGPDLARAVGQYGQVTVSARDIGWGGCQLERMEIRARNVHVRPGPQPVLVAAPVLCEALAPAWAASRWLAAVSPRLSLTGRAGRRSASRACGGRAWKSKRAPGDGRSASSHAPCACSAGACRCAPRPFTCPFRCCPAASCSPQ